MIVDVYGIGMTKDADEFNVDFTKKPIEFEIDVDEEDFMEEGIRWIPNYYSADYSDFDEEVYYYVDEDAMREYIEEQVKELLNKEYDDYDIDCIEY